MKVILIIFAFIIFMLQQASTHAEEFKILIDKSIAGSRHAYIQYPAKEHEEMQDGKSIKYSSSMYKLIRYDNGKQVVLDEEDIKDGKYDDSSIILLPPIDFTIHDGMILYIRPIYKWYVISGVKYLNQKEKLCIGYSHDYIYKVNRKEGREVLDKKAFFNTVTDLDIEMTIVDENDRERKVVVSREPPKNLNQKLTPAQQEFYEELQNKWENSVNAKKSEAK